MHISSRERKRSDLNVAYFLRARLSIIICTVVAVPKRIPNGLREFAIAQTDRRLLVAADYGCFIFFFFTQTFSVNGILYLVLGLKKKLKIIKFQNYLKIFYQFFTHKNVFTVWISAISIPLSDISSIQF